MHTIITLLLSLFLATAAHAGPSTAVVKIAEKIAAHGADNVAEKVIVHNADDAARLAAKGAGRTATHVAPVIERTVKLVQAEARAAKPAVQAAARKPLVRPGTIAAGGVAAGTIIAAHNLTAGEREKDRALANATRNTLAEHPEMLPGVLRADGETGFWNRLAGEAGPAFVRFADVAGVLLVLFSLPGLIRRFRTMRKGAKDKHKIEAPTEQKAA